MSATPQATERRPMTPRVLYDMMATFASDHRASRELDKRFLAAEIDAFLPTVAIGYRGPAEREERERVARFRLAELEAQTEAAKKSLASVEAQRVAVARQVETEFSP